MLDQFVLFFLFSVQMQAEPSFTSPDAFNPGEILSVRNGSANIPSKKPRLLPDCCDFASPPHPYGCMGCSPRLRNFSPSAPPNITVGSTGLPRMMVPLADQPNMFLNFPPTYRQVTTQVHSGHIVCMHQGF